MIVHILHILSRNKITSLLLFLLLSAATLVNILSVGGIMERMQYLFLPRGYTLKNVCYLEASAKNKDETDSLKSVELYNRLKASPYVENISNSSPDLIYNYTRYDMAGYEDKIFSAFFRGGTETMADIMQIKMLHGRWLQASDQQSNGVVITPEAAMALFNEVNVVGKSYDYQGQKYNVVGICNPMRQNKRDNYSPSIFSYRTTSDTYTIRTKEGEEKAFEHSLEGILTATYGTNNHTLYYETFQHQDFRVNQVIYLNLFQFLLQHLFYIVVALLSFLVVIWYTIGRRKQEWSIRYAIGQSKRQITGYIFLENLVILAAAFIFALFLFFIFRQFGVETFATKLTFAAIVVTASLMLLFLWIGIFIPSRKIKQLNMSELLKSE